MALTTRRIGSPVTAWRELDRLVDSVFAPTTYDRRTGSTVSNLPIDVYESDDDYYVHAVMPGADPAEIEVTALGDVVTIAGQAQRQAPEGAKVLWQEIPSIELRRSVQLRRRFDIDRTEAVYENGVLKLRIPKAADAKPRTIKIAAPGEAP